MLNLGIGINWTESSCQGGQLSQRGEMVLVQVDIALAMNSQRFQLGKPFKVVKVTFGYVRDVQLEMLERGAVVALDHPEHVRISTILKIL